MACLVNSVEGHSLFIPSGGERRGGGQGAAENEGWERRGGRGDMLGHRE